MRLGIEHALEWLLKGEHGVAAMRADTHGVSTLHSAVSHSQEKCVKRLLAKTLEFSALEKAR